MLADIWLNGLEEQVPDRDILLLLVVRSSSKLCWFVLMKHLFSLDHVPNK